MLGTNDGHNVKSGTKLDEILEILRILLHPFLQSGIFCLSLLFCYPKI